MSRLPLVLAFRFLGAKQSNTFLNFISIMSGLGLVLGVCSLIVITSVLNGFEEVFENKVLGMVPHASIHLDERVDDWTTMADSIKKSDDNIEAVAPYQQVRAMTSINGDMHGTIINGIIPSYQTKVSVLEDIIVEGSLSSLNQDGNIILGKTLVDKHQLALGDKVSILKVSADSNAIGMKPKFHHFILSGVFKSSEKIDNWFSFVSLNTALEIEGIPKNHIKSFRMQLKDVMISDKSVNIASDVTGQRYTVANNWKHSHSGVYKSLQMNKTVISLLLCLIIIVSAFNIISALMMMISEKKENIAVLKSYGANNRFIYKVFIYQGLIIGLIGTSVGVITGVAISSCIGYLSDKVNTMFHLNLFNQYFVDRLPSCIDYSEVVLIVIVSLAVCLIATILPARKATKVMPAKVLVGS